MSSTDDSPVTAGTVFHNWPIGKGITATIANMLLQSGRLYLDTPVLEWWPGDIRMTLPAGGFARRWRYFASGSRFRRREHAAPTSLVSGNTRTGPTHVPGVSRPGQATGRRRFARRRTWDR